MEQRFEVNRESETSGLQDSLLLTRQVVSQVRVQTVDTRKSREDVLQEEPGPRGPAPDL